MTDTLYRALVVDDDPAVRKATMRAFVEERFSCDAAANGTEAKQLLAANRYDVVVTDLQMPNGHGHALAMELLAIEDRPAIAVLTGMLDPRLAKDLIGRGVEFVEFKPVRYDLLIAKIKALVSRRARRPDRLRGAADFLEAGCRRSPHAPSAAGEGT